MQGKAKGAITGKKIGTVTELITASKKFFAPGGTHADYTARLQSVRRQVDETLPKFHFRIMRLQSSVQAALISFNNSFNARYDRQTILVHLLKQT